jgi:DNA polymerase-3 subunit epsilon
MEQEKNIVWFDLETTGINTATDRIIEICLIKTDPRGNELSRFYSRFNPGPDVEIRPEAFEKHGISLDLLSDEDSFSYIAPEIVEFIGDSDLGGYNILYFDLPLLVEELMRAGIVFDYRSRNVIDPFLIYTKYESRNLESAYKKFTGKTLEGAHAAEVDIRATMEIFAKQKEVYNMPQTAEEIDKAVCENRRDQVDLGGKFKFVELDGKREIVFNFGKWKGQSFRRVYEQDARYIEWMVDKGEFHRETKIIAKKLLERSRAEKLV